MLYYVALSLRSLLSVAVSFYRQMADRHSQGSRAFVSTPPCDRPPLKLQRQAHIRKTLPSALGSITDP